MMSKRWNTLFRVALYFLVAYLPFQMALNLAPDIDLMSGRVLIFVLFGFWLSKELHQSAKDKNTTWIPALTGSTTFAGMTGRILVLFFILSAISIFAAQNQSWGLRKLAFFASIFPLFFLVRALVKKEEHYKKLVYIIVGGAAVSATIALAQFLAQFVFGQEAIMSFWVAHIVPIFSGASFGALVASNPSWQVNIGGQTIMRAIGLFPDPHMLSFYLGLTLPFSLAVMFFATPPFPSPSQGREIKSHRFILFIVNCLLLIVLLLTFSRGGYLGLLAGLAVFFIFAWRKTEVKGKRFFIAFCLTAAAILLLVGWPMATRLISSFDIQEGSNMGRLAIWRDSWQIIKKSPVVGVGLGNYPLAVDFSGDYRSAVTSHNLYLDIWAETGFFGLLAWLLLLFGAAGEAIKKINRFPIIALGALAGLAYFFAHSFFETAIFNPTVLAFLMIVLGLSSARHEE